MQKDVRQVDGGVGDPLEDETLNLVIGFAPVEELFNLGCFLPVEAGEEFAVECAVKLVHQITAVLGVSAAGK